MCVCVSNTIHYGNESDICLDFTSNYFILFSYTECNMTYTQYFEYTYRNSSPTKIYAKTFRNPLICHSFGQLNIFSENDHLTILRTVTTCCEIKNNTPYQYFVSWYFWADYFWYIVYRVLFPMSNFFFCSYLTAS